MEKTYAVLSAGGSPEFVAGKLNELTARQTVLREHLASKEAEQRDFGGRDLRFYTSREEIKELVKKLQLPPSEELYKLRAQIASRLKVLVETLLIAPQGALPAMQRTIQELQKITGEEADDVVAHMQQVAVHPDQSRRYFAVGFRDAAVRAVFPAYDDPLRFDKQIIAGDSASEGEHSIDVVEPPDRRTSIF